MGPLGALGDHADAAEIAREHVDDQAGFFVGIAVQHKAGLAVDAVARQGARTLDGRSKAPPQLSGSSGDGEAGL